MIYHHHCYCIHLLVIIGRSCQYFSYLSALFLFQSPLFSISSCFFLLWLFFLLCFSAFVSCFTFSILFPSLFCFFVHHYSSPSYLYIESYLPAYHLHGWLFYYVAIHSSCSFSLGYYPFFNCFIAFIVPGYILFYPLVSSIVLLCLLLPCWISFFFYDFWSSGRVSKNRFKNESDWKDSNFWKITSPTPNIHFGMSRVPKTQSKLSKHIPKTAWKSNRIRIKVLIFFLRFWLLF